MLKTIHEKDRQTFVYSEPTWGVILITAGVLGLAGGLMAMPSLTPTNTLALLAGPGVAFAIAAYWLTRKQVLVIDGNQDRLEFYVKKQQQVIPFSSIQYADVERVKDDEMETTEPAKEDNEVLAPTEGEPPQDASAEISMATVTKRQVSPALNYHIFLQPKAGAKEKVFLFDNGGRGIQRYRDAKQVIEAINTFVGVPKVTTENLNVHQLKPNHGRTGLIGLAMILIMGAAIIGLAYHLNWF